MDHRSAILYEVYPQLDALGVDGVARLLGSFAGIADEARQVTNAAFRAYGQISGEGDMGDFAENALDEGLQYYQTLAELQQGVTNLLAVGLYHLFEQHSKHIRELLIASGKVYPDVRRFSTWPKVDELRLLCNAVKHADGTSAEVLRGIRPDYFVSPIMRRYTLHRLSEAHFHPLATPMGGTDLFVSREDLTTYRDVLRDFWEEFLEHS